MNFSIIIPSKDRKEILKQSLEKLSCSTNLADLEVIVINDSDKDLQLENHFAFAKIFKNNKSGVAAARNFGASNASHDWLVFMDDDMWVQPDTFEKIIPFCKKNHHCLNINWVYPSFLQAQLPTNPFLRYLRNYGFDSMEGWNNGNGWDREKVFKADGITSQFLLIHKEAFSRTGGYNAKFPFAGFEDHDFSHQLNKAGIKIFVDPLNVIFHNEADRIDVRNWLERKRRGAVTRKVGVSAGYTELTLSYPALKKTAYYAVYQFRRPFLFLLRNWPQTKTLDKIYFFLVNVLLGTYSCIGYNSKEAIKFVRANLKT